MTRAIVIKLCRTVSRVISAKSTDNPRPEVGVGVSSEGGVMITTARTPSGVKLGDPLVSESEVGVAVTVGVVGLLIELFGSSVAPGVLCRVGIGVGVTSCALAIWK